SVKLDLLKNLPELRCACPVVELDAVAVKNESFAVVRLVGVSSEFWKCQEGLPMVFGRKALNANEGLIGINLADKLGISENPGLSPYLALYYPGRLGKTLLAEEAFSSRRVAVSGAFRLHQEANSRWIILNDSLVHDLAGSPDFKVTYVGLWLKEKAALHSVKAAATSLVSPGFQVLNREEQQKDVYKVLRVEKLAVFIFIGFIAVIASFILYGAGSLLIIEKQRSAAVFAALGLSASALRQVFMLWLFTVGAGGAFLGVGAGWILVMIQRYAPFVYFSSHPEAPPFPVLLEVSDALGVSLFLSLLAAGTAWLRVQRWAPDLRDFQTFKT
ncbi:MAG: hypothetical protein N2050_01355, partial [Flavobacteriales bacterium]|nr:hypothetical protein [Flavobacteriales bacterium]MCX7649185.1 hypothetical protein [Flavobacteriales bacterium]MDW8432658.1 FtsX-like permease family protein [Flavobacteriales bacterium]